MQGLLRYSPLPEAGGLECCAKPPPQLQQQLTAQSIQNSAHTHTHTPPSYSLSSPLSQTQISRSPFALNFSRKQTSNQMSDFFTPLAGISHLPCKLLAVPLCYIFQLLHAPSPSAQTQGHSLEEKQKVASQE